MYDRKEKEKFARNLNRNPTFCEARLALSLKREGLNFVTNPIIYGFIPDFYFHRARLVVEVDGSVHDLPHVKENDRRKDEVFKAGGLTVLRFTNKEIMGNLGFVVKTICEKAGHKKIQKNKFNKKWRRRGKKKNKFNNGNKQFIRGLDPVYRFRPGENKTLYVPPVEEKKKIPLKIKRIIRK